jgi:hypothetical protein
LSIIHTVGGPIDSDESIPAETVGDNWEGPIKAETVVLNGTIGEDSDSSAIECGVANGVFKRLAVVCSIMTQLV